jgi:hypothetical protein
MRDFAFIHHHRIASICLTIPNAGGTIHLPPLKQVLPVQASDVTTNPLSSKVKNKSTMFRNQKFAAYTNM